MEVNKMKFTMTISENTLNTIITALRIERTRANEEGNAKNIAIIENALDDIDKNTYIASVRDVN
jgi:hypothetical protein